jgi:hypothetical protein
VDGYIQPRLEVAQDSSLFRFSHARLGVSGPVTPWATYRAMIELQSGGLGAGQQTTVSTVDLYLQLTHRHWTVLAGQHKTQLGREFIINPPELELPDLPLVIDGIVTNRDIGVRVDWRGDGPRRVLLQGGVYNGEGRNRTRNDDGVLLVTGRAVVAVGGFELGAAATTQDDDTRWGLEAAWQRGRAEARAEFLRRDVGGAHGDGWYVFGGWMLRPDRLQLLGRVEEADPNSAVGGDDFTGYTAGLQWLLRGDNLKLQAALTLYDNATATIDDRLVVQGQVRF